MISTRGRYALRVMIDLAEHRGNGYITMKEIAERQELSIKYMERIMPSLTDGGLVEGAHGKGGGYKLVREPDEYTALEILCLTEGDLAPVACLEKGAKACERAAECRTLPVWKGYYKLTCDYFGSIKLSDLMSENGSDNYVI